MTEKLYYKDVYAKDFDATVVDIKRNNNFFEVILDRTLFYPEGGGQPGDIGFINNFKVVDTKIKNDIITHYIEDDAIDLKVNDKVHGSIDFDRRFEIMQSHTAEHIVSGIANKLYGCDNIGFEISEHYVTIDLSKDLDETELQNLEKLSNEAIVKGEAVNIMYPSKEELNIMQYRSKKELEGDVRIVSVGELDTCACCGLHCYNLNEVGLLKFITVKKNKGGVRIKCLMGYRALRDYDLKNKLLYDIGNTLSLPPEDTAVAVNDLVNENKSLLFEVNKLKKTLLELEVSSLDFDTVKVVVKNNISADETRHLNNLLQSKSDICLVLNVNDDIKFVIGSKNVDVREVTKTLTNEFNGRGGGSKSQTQGTLIGDTDVISDFFVKLCNNIQ